ncbi:hypothetical protein I6N95_12465 [Vagococcus sp. BWB3-3]|uniref:Uncharacterized protein n=1 Tax=Vagococcus allomyrinae TaxID=2794353 RepID=A0A940P5A0_9ENTE|nr:hypothetical protein [Vagococcus allomyrinae]MBP1041824.1 hypothetical protein [Vagococcus allomyrinae]
MDEKEMYELLLETNTTESKLIAVDTDDNENFEILYQKLAKEYFYLFRLVKTRHSTLDSLHTIQYDSHNLTQLLRMINFELQIGHFFKLTLSTFNLLKELNEYLDRRVIYFDFRRFSTNQDCFLDTPETAPMTKLITGKYCRKVKQLIAKGLVGIEELDKKEVLILTSAGKHVLQLYEDQLLAQTITDEPQKTYNLTTSQGPMLFTHNDQYYFITRTQSKYALYQQVMPVAKSLPHIKDKDHPSSQLPRNHYGVVTTYFDWRIGRRVAHQFKLLRGDLASLESCYNFIEKNDHLNQ